MVTHSFRVVTVLHNTDIYRHKYYSGCYRSRVTSVDLELFQEFTAGKVHLLHTVTKVTKNLHDTDATDTTSELSEKS